MRSDIQLATALANLCWARPFSLLGHARSVIHIPQDLTSAPAPARTPRREETASCPAFLYQPFLMQDLLLAWFCNILWDIPSLRTGSSSDFLSIWKVLVAHRCPLPSTTTADPCSQRPSLPHLTGSGPLLEHPRLGVWFLAVCWLTAVRFSDTRIARLIHRVNVLSRS